MKKKKTAFTFILALTLCLATLISSLAIFRDYESITISSNNDVATMDIVFTDKGSFLNRVGEIDCVSKCWNKQQLLSGGCYLIPGSGIDLSYELTNSGLIAADVRQQIVITSTKAFDPSNPAISLRKYDSAFINSSDKTEEPFTGEVYPVTYSNDNKTMTFTMPEVTLRGTSDTYGDTSDCEYVCFYFDDTNNSQLGATITLEYQMQAKQHQNTTATDWIAWSDLTTISKVTAGV